MQVSIKTFKQAGVLAWEYNPFRNYRIKTNIKEGQKVNELVDFETDQLQFSLEHPVDIIPQYSYDGSVNLILNDGLNSPKLINSRFSVTEKNEYQIVDRKGNNDSNIYDEDQFDIETSLYKTSTTIPKVKLVEVAHGGSLSVGNYHFYFKLQDADGNSTDFIAESGLVSVFIGTTPHSINSGFVNQNSNKLIQLQLTNVDSAYPYVEVYYTRSTSEIKQNSVIEAKVIDKKFIVNNFQTCNIIITGDEITQDIAITDINTSYIIVKNAETQTTCQSRLFLGNIETPEINHKELTKLSLFITPKAEYKQYDPGLDQNYGINNIENSYYDPKFIYNYTGYWESEYYRFGVVYIYKNNQLSPVFNVRGCLNIDSDTELITNVDLENINLQIDEETTMIVGTDHNASGVVTFAHPGYNQIIGIKFNIPDKIIEELKKQDIVGMFFVRQKRIPKILAQALTIATDKESHTPIIPAQNGILNSINGYVNNTTEYIAERFIDNDSKLGTSFANRLYFVNNILNNAAICPDYDVNEEYLNAFFTGNDLYAEYDYTQPNKEFLESNYGRHFYNKELITEDKTYIGNIKVIGIPDSMPLSAIGDSDFSARAGYPEDVSKFEFLDIESKKSGATNLIRGNFGSYIGFDQELQPNKIINIKTLPSTSDFMIRAQDKSSFYAISDRIELTNEITCYRGDCYICQFTHRINRNFNDPTAPYNDKIVDPNTFKDKLKYDNDSLNRESLNDVNLGDVNAVQLGMWVTSTYRSSINHNVRAVDESYISETASVGHPRGFYPLQPMSTAGSYKLPEAKCYNKGMEVSVSSKWNALSAEVPAFKNDFSNRILYSEVHINDAYVNGYRVFKSTYFRDYNKELGSITKLVTIGTDIMCIFEHGIGIIPVKERVISGEGSGGSIYINTSNVLPEKLNILSDNIGSQWKDSILKTPFGVYGIDTVAKKLWRATANGVELLSENYLMQEFVNNNITLGERELIPIIGIRNVKTVYNAFKNDVMFTFYDNLEGIQEKAWNLCYNEKKKVFTTFYSWIPSFMECIDNIPFSFDRTTSKILGKIKLSKEGQDLTVENVVIKSHEDVETGNLYEYKLKYKNEIITPDKFTIHSIKAILNGEFFNLQLTDDYQLKVSVNDYNNIKNKYSADNLFPEDLILNVEITLGIKEVVNGTLEEIRREQHSLNLIFDFFKDKLTTAFWKHGQAGLMDNTEDIKPTNWYGKQHPFEFECIVVNDPSTHKVFSNLELVANKAEPESFHYEIIGESFDFAKDKPNMYYRQEALRALWQANDGNITYDSKFTKTPLKQQPKSTDFVKKYYYRQDRVNSVEDYYHLKNSTNKYDYKHLSGAELKYYPNRQEYRIWQHSPAINVDTLSSDDPRSLISANCKYLEDRWKIQINPILICYKNEYDNWINGKNDVKKPPLPIYNSELPKEVFDKIIKDESLKIPEIIEKEYNGNNFIDSTDWLGELSINRKEIDLKDKFIKIRIRYSGEELAVIDFLNTVYRVSYS